MFRIKLKTYTGAFENRALMNIFAHSCETGDILGSNRLLGVPEGTPDFIVEVMFFSSVCARNNRTG
jgi:hypothetical protein